MKGIVIGGLVAMAAMASAQVQVIEPAQGTAAEKRAARELGTYLRQMSGVRGIRRVLVGLTPEVQRLCPDVSWDRLGSEELVLRTVGQDLVVAGGRPRGTIYGVYRLLHRMGVRWWTPWATHVPKSSAISLAKLIIREAPAFEYREPFWFHAFDPDWTVRNLANSQMSKLDEERGSGMYYEGFVHTFYPLVPPERYFSQHPEWYSLINGKRTVENAQLCTTDPEMRKVMLEEVRRRLRANRKATIVSVSQNDCFNPCQCDRCQALAKAEGSEAAPVLDLANYVADGIREEFPQVAVDTLAYQYTRKAPNSMRPRPNVIVRLCSIECDFGVPLDHARNADFLRDLKDWSRLTQRLYVWDYTTNFRHYLQPFPNVQVLGDNLRIFSKNGVKGVFEQGAYQSTGGEFAELKAWVLAQLLWNPKADPRKLRDEFLSGYYGSSAGPIRSYLDLLARHAAAAPARIYDDSNAPYLSYRVMREAEALWSSAEKAARDPETLRRVQVGHLAVQYVWLRNWSTFRREADRQGHPWPLAATRRESARQWLTVAQAAGPAGWTPIRLVNEGGLTVKAFAEQVSQEPPPPPVRRMATAPVGVSGEWIDLQDEGARIWNEPVGAAFVRDATASDGGAVRMPGSHLEWAFQVDLSNLPPRARMGRWRIYVVARVEGSGDGNAFSAGVYDGGASRMLDAKNFPVPQATGGYRAFEIGTLALPTNGYVWVAPPNDSRVRHVWVDRVYLVRE